MNICFENFIKAFPPSDNLTKPTEETIAKYENLLPADLLEFWKEYGFGDYGGGLLRVINPSDYEEAEGVNISVDIPLLTDSFGDIFIFRSIPAQNLKAVGILNVHFRNREFFIVDEDCIEELFGGINPEMPMMRAELFQEAVQKFGKPEPNEIFFFAPALAMGGGESIEFVQKGDAFTHYAMLMAMAGDFKAQY